MCECGQSRESFLNWKFAARKIKLCNWSILNDLGKYLGGIRKIDMEILALLSCLLIFIFKCVISHTPHNTTCIPYAKIVFYICTGRIF